VGFNFESVAECKLHILAGIVGTSGRWFLLAVDKPIPSLLDSGAYQDGIRI